MYMEGRGKWWQVKEIVREDSRVPRLEGKRVLR
jgi:hypothetical protein